TASPLRDKVTGQVVLRHDVRGDVIDVRGPQGVHGPGRYRNTFDSGEGSSAQSETVPLGHIGTVRIELLDPSIEGVGHVDALRAVDCDAVRMVKLTWTVARNAYLQEVITNCVKFLDSVVVSIGDVHVACAVNRDSERKGKL